MSCQCARMKVVKKQNDWLQDGESVISFSNEKVLFGVWEKIIFLCLKKGKFVQIEEI